MSMSAPSMPSTGSIGRASTSSTSTNTTTASTSAYALATAARNSLEPNPNSLTSTHPLFTQPPPTLTVTSPTPTPAIPSFAQPRQYSVPSQLPPPPAPIPAPARVASLRGNLPRRRSSYPPATSTPNNNSGIIPTADLFAELGLTELGNMWTPVGWETLLDFDGDKPKADVFPSTSAMNAQPGPSNAMARVQSDPGSADGMRKGTGVSMEAGKLAQLGDLAWRTILASQVEVEGVGQVGVVKILQEVWRRGGGDQVSQQCLWPSIIISLSLPEIESPGFRLPTPSAHSALALQNLYNLTLRHWEPSIFTGLLSSFGNPTPAPRADPPASSQTQAFSNVFGVSTPQKELDLSQWTNLTPGGDWSFLNTLEPDPLPLAIQKASQANLYADIDRRGSKSTDDDIKGIDEILAQMEEGNTAREIAAIQEQIEAATSVADRRSDAFQMPTPETDSSDVTTLSRPDRGASFQLVTPPSSNGSPFTPVVPPRAPGGQSAFSRLATPASSSSSIPKSKKADMQLTMPIANFVPPPPMCMFFSPAFHDLQKGKVGVWKGDLEVRGKGGGKFSVLIVGESTSGHLWQSHLWPTSVVYPPEPQASDATATATMIPVSHLAREGFTPAAMGMVLCNDTNIEAYVQMVQGFHAEGVAFHLTTPSRLPIVFLPAKFNSDDPLQRLGVAFMTKAGMQPRPTASASASATPATNNADLPDDGPKKKKRRQSAPASAIQMPRANAAKQKKRESLSARRPAGIAEEVVETG